MKGDDRRTRSILQRVGNRGRERRLSRMDAITAYAMDRLLYRLGRSPQAKEFYLKGGVLVANLVDAPHRFTRDIDLLRRHGPPDLEEMRTRFREIAAVPADDGLRFPAEGVRATLATRELDGYDGVRVSIRGMLGETEIDVHIDIGFGDALVPLAERIELTTFLDEDPAAEVYAYEVGPVLAEKIETLISKFPVIRHRLKDLLDVVILADQGSFRGEDLVRSLRATFERRETAPDLLVLDELLQELRGRKWATDWATMQKEKAVAVPVALTDALVDFDVFVRPLLAALVGDPAPGAWDPGGPWKPENDQEGPS